MALVCLVRLMAADLQAEIIPSDRRINWSTAGIPGGIPAIATTVNVKGHGARGDGTTDDSQAFSNAIHAVTAPGAVRVPAGTYLIKSTIDLKEGVVLRGDSAERTHIIIDVPNGDGVRIASWQRGSFVDVTDGATKGSTTLTVSDASSFTTGCFAEIQQENDADAMYTDPRWNTDWAANAVGQILSVKARTGNTLTLSEPLHLTFKSSLKPRVRSLGLIRNAGLENLHLKRTAAGDYYTVLMNLAGFCWVSGCELEDTMKAHVGLRTSYHCVIRDNYFHQAHNYGGGGHGYGIQSESHSTLNLLENNILRHLRHAFVIQLGANGNVYGYNYSGESFWSEPGPSQNAPDFSFHGHYPFMNLVEGNVCDKVDCTDWWGPAGPGNTLFRNRTIERGISIRDASHQQNIVGNELTTAPNGLTVAASAKDALVHGNRVDGRIQWSPAIPDRALPDSYYLPAKPAFFGPARWPVTGADRPDAGMIPAEARFKQQAIWPYPPAPGISRTNGAGSGEPPGGLRNVK